jgi:hypothetical protein
MDIDRLRKLQHTSYFPRLPIWNETIETVNRVCGDDDGSCNMVESLSSRSTLTMQRPKQEWKLFPYHDYFPKCHGPSF